MPADPKPKARVKADLKDWDTMRLVLEDAKCQVCGLDRGRVGLSLHHIVPRSQGGDDVPENLAVLCGHGTVGCHGDVEQRRNGARERLAAALTPDQRAYADGKKWAGWVEEQYG